MPFDQSNAADLTALKTEVETDPSGRGYIAQAGNTFQQVDLLNEDIGAAVTVPTEDLNIPDIAAVIDATEYGALSDYDKEWVKMFINQPVEIGLKQFQAKFLSLFGNGSATRTAALALKDKTGSRAEELFGAGTRITRGDLLEALKNG